MSKSDRFQEKGSALLVVLGFLTFMIVSAVSFCIYMRVERQASSNYRHSITARHLLESALYRAMDEVDEDLRKANTKFPKFPENALWDNRIFISTSNTQEKEQARVLSLEALSFMPASLVNDARVSAVSGVEWRRMSMPIESNVDIKNNKVKSSGDKSFVGRYAYICVNLSDMPNINGCTNVVRGVSNLVSAASMFADENTQIIDWGKAQRFSEQAVKDVAYTTLQDFYACMDQGEYFEDPSPCNQFLRSEGNEVFNKARKHLLVTDGFAKEEPLDPANSCNLGVLTGQPFAKGVLDGAGTDFPQLQADFGNAFMTAEAPLAPMSYVNGVLPGLLFDYLAEDSKAARGTDTPSVKLGPMICQFLLTPLMSPQIKRRVEPDGEHTKTIVELQLFSDLFYVDPSLKNMSFQMRVCYPFKNISEERRNREYRIKVSGLVRVVPERTDAEPTSAALGAGIDFPFECNGSMNPSAGQPHGVPAVPTENECYVTLDPTKMTLTGPAFDTKQVVKMLTIDKDNNVIPENGFAAEKNFSVLLIISSARIYNPENKLIDSVPANRLSDVGAPEMANLPKLYFETKPEKLVVGIADGKKIEYEWQSLEAPDPRFNYSTLNWVNNTDAAEAFRNPGMHDVTRALLGKEGRDGDLFMTVSTGKWLSSPGELGFIIRPFTFKGGDLGANFRTQTKIDPNIDESSGYFRTWRLYDHDDQKRDNVYKYFMNADDQEGNLPRANNVRVNPLSTSKEIIKMALSAIPYDYSMTPKKPTDNYMEGILKDNWKVFSDKWVDDIMKVVETENLSNNFAKNIATCESIAKMKWYDPDLPLRQRLKCLDVALTKPLHEIDRKMLYAFSLDAMSDRQQLFLYVFQAESVAPISFTEMRSLAGGRAVAVVWRDPYPKGSSPDKPKGEEGSWYERSTTGGSKGYHEHKILYFKQLDN